MAFDLEEIVCDWHSESAVAAAWLERLYRNVGSCIGEIISLLDLLVHRAYSDIR